MERDDVISRRQFLATGAAGAMTLATMREALVGLRLLRVVVVVAVVLGSLLGGVGSSQAAIGVVRVVIAGALSSPTGASGDGQITLRVGTNRPVSLVESGAIVPGPIGTATLVRWTDTTPSAGFGAPADLMVFRFGGGFMVVAGGIATPGGPVTTFSATDPVETLSGTWTMTGGAGSGVAGATASDAVVTFTSDTNPTNTISGLARFVADGLLPAVANKSIPGVASVSVVRNIPVRDIVNNAVVAPQTGMLTSYSVFSVTGAPSEFAALTAINFGGVYVLYSLCVPSASRRDRLSHRWSRPGRPPVRRDQRDRRPVPSEHLRRGYHRPRPHALRLATLKPSGAARKQGDHHAAG